jgi:hypothetical protein
MRKAVVRKADGFVENVIEFEEGANWQPPEGCNLVDAEKEGSPGDTWDGEKFVRPILPIPEPARDDEPAPVIISEPIRNPLAEIDQIKADIQAIKKELGVK